MISSVTASLISQSRFNRLVPSFGGESSLSCTMMNLQQTEVSEKIIIGVDPGTQVMGYGVISVKNQQISLVQYGVIHLSKYTTHELKLKKIFERITQLIED